MTQRLSLFTAALIAGICSAASPAFAGIPVPGPEAGVGLAAMTLVGSGYYFLKQRLNRR